jgi:rubrerythrin
MFFNEIEAARIAQNMETNGLEFYAKSAARTKDAAVRRVFEQLAKDEEEHLDAFTKLERALEVARTAPPEPGDDEAELGAYIQRLLETQVFSGLSDATRLGEQAKDDYEALATAMRAERDAIVFYGEMLNFVDSKAAQEAFTWILDEERKHLRILGDRAEAIGH